jgi:general secretion pathway protein J
MKRASATAGFTLVELLVAIALLAGVMLALMTAMRSFAQIEERIDLQAQRDDDFRSSVLFVRRILGSMSPRAVKVDAGAPKQIAFAGAADRIEWIGVMPARQGAGGLSRFRLSVGDAEGAHGLLLEFAPLTDLDKPLESGPLQSRVLATEVVSIALRYRESDRPDAQWLDTWPAADKLPMFVSLQVSTATGTWPELVMLVIPVAGPGNPDGSRGGGPGSATVGPA